MSRKYKRNSETEEQTILRHAREDGTELADSELMDFKSVSSFPKQAARVGRPVKENPKKATTIRFDADIIDAFKAGGKGWQTRINTVLREYLEAHKTTV